MAYSRGDVRAALARAKDAGADCLHMRADDRETVFALEKWGFLPLDPVKANAKVADWYVAQGLAVRTDKMTSARPPAPSSEGSVAHAQSENVPSHVSHNVDMIHESATDAAMSAAEAALGAAQAALILARAMHPAGKGAEREREREREREVHAGSRLT